MANAVNKSATFTCSHSGVATISSADGKLSVDGDPIVTQTEFESMSGFAACTNLHPTPPSGVQCTSVTVSSGVSTKLKKGGNGVILANGTFITDSSPAPGTLIVSSNQSKLAANA